VSEEKSLCPQCGTPMEETPDEVEPHAIPSVAKQPLDDVEAGVLLKRLECPKCHHAEAGFRRAMAPGKTHGAKALFDG
jgi:ribosomal protein S27AE